MPQHRLRFSLVYDFRNPAHLGVSFPKLYEDVLEHVARVDELGFHAALVSEHHFFDDGYAPAPLTLLAAMAARTGRIRLGTHVLVLPLHNAIQVAEEAAVLDVVSNGRSLLGLGQGRRAEEFGPFGIPMAERASRMEEGLHVLRGLLGSSATFSFQGRHYRFAELCISPRPLQHDGPPLYVAATSPPAARRAARHRTHLAPFGMREATIDVWKASLREAGEDPERYEVAVLRPILATEDPRLAQRIVEEDRRRYQNSYTNNPQIKEEMQRLFSTAAEGTRCSEASGFSALPGRSSTSSAAMQSEPG